MKRSELKRGGPLKRTPLRNNYKPEPSELRDGKAAARERSGGICEVKGPACTTKATHVHHVRGRGFKGCHDPALLLNLCSPCHDFVHSHPTISYREGWMQRRN